MCKCLNMSYTKAIIYFQNLMQLTATHLSGKHFDISPGSTAF